VSLPIPVGSACQVTKILANSGQNLITKILPTLIALSKHPRPICSECRLRHRAKASKYRSVCDCTGFGCVALNRFVFGEHPSLDGIPPLRAPCTRRGSFHIEAPGVFHGLSKCSKCPPSC
jgi:hypothetical protein